MTLINKGIDNIYHFKLFRRQMVLLCSSLSMAGSPLHWLCTCLLRVLMKKNRTVVVIGIVSCNSSDVNEEEKKVSGRNSYYLPSSRLKVEPTVACRVAIVTICVTIIDIMYRFFCLIYDIYISNSG